MLTETKQCWGFIIGSSFFAAATMPGMGGVIDARLANILCFIGAWFFTAAGLIQLFLSGPIRERISSGRRVLSAAWLTAATQSFGTIMFNVSTIAALVVVSQAADRHLVWRPDAGGSIAFLVSGCFAFIAYARTARMGDFGNRDWWAVLVNFAGCVAFGVSAIGAYVLMSGSDLSAAVASGGTFVGALCFLAAAVIALPAWERVSKRRFA